MIRCCRWHVSLIVPLSLIAGTHVAAEDASPTFYNGLARPNGKQILRLGEQWLVVTPDQDGRRAWVCNAPRQAPIKINDNGWQRFPLVSVDDDGPFASKSPCRPCPVPPSLIADRNGRVHALWGDGEAVWYAAAKAGATDDLRRQTSWTDADGQKPKPIIPQATPGDIVVNDSGQAWIAAVKKSAGGSTTLCVARHAEKWETEDLAEGVGIHPPVLHLASDGSAHIAWSDTRGRILYLRYRPGEKAEPRVLCQGGYGSNGRNPNIIANGRQLFVVYESLYAQIEFAVEENGQWRTNQRLTSVDPRFATDVLHSPQLALDRHGIVWLFFSDATRKFTYFTRWLGSAWSDIYDGRGIYYRAPRFETNLLGADWFAVEKYPPPGATEIGISLANSLAAEMREFHCMPIPAPAAVADSNTLFLDLLETAGLDDAELVLDEAQKEPKNPLLGPGPPGAFDQDRVFNHGSVLFDDDKFRMWYAGVYRRKGVYWWEWLSIGYAESRDGIAWKRVPTGVSAERESDGNRLPTLPWPCAVFKDSNDTDPNKRYKVVQFDRHQRQLMASVRGEYDMDSPVCPGGLHQSRDGIHWTTEPISITFPDGKPWELVVQSFFIDPREPDPGRRWKIYGYATLVARRRAGCYAYSADGKKWISYPRNPILDPTVSEVPMVPAGPQAQIHDTVVFPYRGYHLALFHAQHDQNFLDVELAVSRDGANFAHVKPGRKVISLGARGDWDWQQILQSTPVVAQDKLFLFYGGQTQTAEMIAKGQFNNEQIVGSAGLATLRLDGFTHMSLKPGKTNGSVTTVPFEIRRGKPLRLMVNAACAPDATIAVELLEPLSGRPIPGFTRDEVEPISSDNLRNVVRWKGGDLLPQDGFERVALRFYLAGRETSPKLYGFSFAIP